VQRTADSVKGFLTCEITFYRKTVDAAARAPPSHWKRRSTPLVYTHIKPYRRSFWAEEGLPLLLLLSLLIAAKLPKASVREKSMSWNSSKTHTMKGPF
jgi:hypothetical protein